MTNIVTAIDEWQTIRKKIAGQTLGFVPTMGNLHAGHLALCQRAKTENAFVVVSIFVNPTQFNQAQDFTSYPRTFAADHDLLTQLGVDYILFPAQQALYPDDYHIQISETELSQTLEGEFRPGHFTGMLTVVLKLLNLVQANKTYFGEKDYQQLLLVQKMAAALFVPTEIIGCPTVRAADGLALSSRNSRLNAAQRELAAHFTRILQSDVSVAAMTQQLTQLGFTVEYIAEQWGRRLAAVKLGDVRLIDNIPINAAN